MNWPASIGSATLSASRKWAGLARMPPKVMLYRASFVRSSGTGRLCEPGITSRQPFSSVLGVRASQADTVTMGSRSQAYQS